MCIRDREYSGPDLEVIDLKTSFSDSARTRFFLKANLYQVFNDGKELYPEGINVDIYSKDDKNITANFLDLNNPDYSGMGIWSDEIYGNIIYEFAGRPIDGRI